MGDIDLSATQLPGNGLQLFAVDAGNAIRTCWKVSGEPGAAWTPWVGFPGQVHRIAAGRLPQDVPQLWAIGGDQQLYTCWKVSSQPGADWTGWSPMPGAPATVTDVAAARLPQDGLQLFAIDGGNAVWTCWKVSGQPGADWSGWMQFPGQVRRIAAGRLPQDVPQLWAIGTDQQLYTCWKVSSQPGANWTGWGPMPGAPASVVDVVAVELPQGFLQLFAIDAGHAIWTCWKVSNQPGADWTGWMQFPGQARRIGSGSLPGGVPQLWAIGVDDQKLYTCWKVSADPGADWTDWGAFDAGQGTPSTGEANAKRAQVILRHLYCANTTEAGHDEVYYIMGGTDGDGKQISHRGPDATQGADADNQTAWDMNDSGGQQNRDLNAVLYDGVLQPDQAATLLFSFLESDGTNFGTTIQAAAALAQKVDKAANDPNPTVQIVAGVAEFVGGIIPTNQDDFLGAFALRVRNDNGRVAVTEATPGSYTSVVHPLDPGTGLFTYRFQHDDGDYNAHFEVRGVA